MPHATQLQADQSALLVIDVQEKLLPKITGAETLVRDISYLIDAARLLNVLVLATEQYPKGLGATVAPLLSKLPERPEKTAFSCCGIPTLTASFQGRKQIVLVGIEAHVCVLNTALDLLADGYQVHLVTDAVGSRFPHDREIAFRRLEQAGVILTTVETAIFEWTGNAKHPAFKQISAIIQERMK